MKEQQILIENTEQIPIENRSTFFNLVPHFQTASKPVLTIVLGPIRTTRFDLDHRNIKHILSNYDRMKNLRHKLFIIFIKHLKYRELDIRIFYRLGRS